MNNFLRTIIAGYGAKKLGGGCFGTIIVFIIIYYALGTCNSHPVQTVPQHHSSLQKVHRTDLTSGPKISVAALKH
ncbi:hypothetical protein FW778_01760 [Ginsengibacter hankyongi]|uniref:Uncharacterized protein n=1 Tax=Ginsengibacter hankyongi TaxID=2607284 RepID=A0A5J5IK98_9BACT|nr:hypothetical protein [Ginsengibacter hankyongi]KAA9040793.1 hypothetical protein FW778_01760 [Ginsengibacter hankyongi]